jgi:hypothetical protein
MNGNDDTEVPGKRHMPATMNGIILLITVYDNLKMQIT